MYIKILSNGTELREFNVGEEVWIIYGTVVVRCKITEIDDYFRKQHPDAYLFYDVDEPIGHSLSEDELSETKEEAIEALYERLEEWKNEVNHPSFDKETRDKIINRFYNDTLDDIRRKTAEFIGATHEGNKPSETKTPFVQKFADDLLKNYPKKIEGKDWFRCSK